MPRSRRAETVDAAFLRRWPLPRIDPKGGKESRGAVLVVGGAPQMPGAIILAATAALRAGAGKLQIATVRSVASIVGAQVPEALVVGLPETREGGIAPSAAREIAKRAESSTAVLVGPGMVDTRAATKLVLDLLGRIRKTPLLLDAEALACASVAPRKMASASTEIAVTPHAGEMAKMLEIEPAEVTRNPAAVATQAARALKAIVALKGSDTFIASPSGRLLCNRLAGNAGLGTSGSGDTLAGIAAGLAARGADLLQALAWAVFLHGRAGDALARKVGPVGYLARELLAEVPLELTRLSRRR
jgi:ADP-dependent NAD(P)H-hydrate dehydratase